MKTYKEAGQILERIKNSQRILLSLHLDPDPDSFGSNLALALILKGLNKDVLIICSDKVNEDFSFLKGFNQIKHQDIKEVDPDIIDLYIALDSADTKMITHHDNFIFPNEKIIVIDHHKTNTRFAKISLVDGDVGSCCELLYELCKLWSFNIDKDIATCLMLGIAGDTGTFRYYTGVTPETFKSASELLELGADYTRICFSFFQNTPFETLKYWGLVLNKLKLESFGNYTFVYSAVSLNEALKVAKPEFANGASSLFFQTTRNTDFGLLLTEEEENVIGGSFRGRTSIDVSELARLFGGGGHEAAAGFTLKGYSFEKGTIYILDTVKEYLRKNEKK